MKSRMAGVLNLCFSIFKDFLLPAPFFRGLRRRDFGKIEEKSFTKLWALDCWFSRTKSSAFFALKKGATDWRYDMNEELTPQKERFLREVEQKLLRKELDARLSADAWEKLSGGAADEWTDLIPRGAAAAEAAVTHGTADPENQLSRTKKCRRLYEIHRHARGRGSADRQGSGD